MILLNSVQQMRTVAMDHQGKGTRASDAKNKDISIMII